MGEKAWTLQEKLKGRTATGEILGSYYGGWGFNQHWYIPVEGGVRPPTPQEATGLRDDQLISDPLFVPGPEELHNGNGSAYAAERRNTLLAEMIPARTLPAGGNRIISRAFILPDGEDRNFDLTSTDFQNGWPQDRLSNNSKRNRWLHSDINNVGYPFTWKLFDKFKNLGALDE
jgi:hypothetical protein